MNRSTTGALRLLLFVSTLCMISAASQPLLAQSFSIEQVMSSPFPSQLTAAKQGSRIAWVFNLKGDQNVWVADGPEFVPKQVTHYVGDNGEPINSLRLTPDGSSVIYARGTELNHDDLAANVLSEPKQPKQQVWIAKVDGGEPRLLGEMGCPEEDCEDIQVSPDGKWAVWPAKHALWIASTTSAEETSAKQLTEIRGTVASPQWSPDGARLVATVDRKDHILTVILDVTDGVLDQIHYVAPSTDRDLSPRWSPDGAHIAFLRIGGIEQKRLLIPQYAQPWSIWVADTHTYTAAPIWKSGFTLRDSLPEFGPTQFFFAADGRIIFASEADNRDHLYSIAYTGGPSVLLTSGDYDVEDVSLSADKRSLLLASNEDDVDRRHVWEVPVAGGSAPRALAKGDTIEWAPVATADGKAIFCLGSSATTPALVYQLSGGSRQLITKDALPADFPTAELVVPKQVIFESSDGLTIHGQLFVPKGQTKRGPAVIFTHGGPVRQMLLGFHYMDAYHYAYAENEYLASLGFTVLSVNYRLGIMYGHDFREPPNAAWRGASEYKDILAGAHYLQSLPTVDPKRIGLWGLSYGGLNTALALARNSDIFAAGVDLMGVHDWSDLLADDEEGVTSAPDLKEAKKLAYESSPDASVDKWKSPVLLIASDDDRNVPFSQTVTLVQKLRSYHVPFEEMIYPDEIHGFLLWKNLVQGEQATAEFFQRRLGPNTTSTTPK
jgi:dipeptidyl aminopeptidase/acylaminoacyl peptidase